VAHLLDFIVPVCWLLTTLTSNPPLYAAPFWTFSCLLAASTSNPPLFRSPFGLHPAYLLAPHCFNVQSATLCRSLLDFLVAPHRFNVQSATLCSSPLDFLLPSHHSNVQFATLHLGVRTSSQKTLDFQTQIYT
jgi:hypothetical protein